MRYVSIRAATEVAAAGDPEEREAQAPRVDRWGERARLGLMRALFRRSDT
jgi:hypothetical protein